MVVNDPLFFLSHRLPLAKAALAEGYSVHVATMPGASADKIERYGFTHHKLPFTRSGVHPIGELVALIALLRLCLKLKPTILHLVTIKPVLYGGIVARVCSIKGVVAAVSGLGFVFTAREAKYSILRELVKLLYRVALSQPNVRVIFQNPDDLAEFVKSRVVFLKQAILIKGSGVNLAEYSFKSESYGQPAVVFAGRLLRDKGVVEFVSAVRMLHARGVNARFRLLGSIDLGNPSSIQGGELEKWREEGIVECLGYRTDIAEIFADSHIVVLPSYREGLPKVLMEAAACGRAVVTTDVPGCRDAIEAGVTGLLVPVYNIEALADAIQKLVENPQLRQRMGRAARELAEREFTVENVVQQHLNIYRTLGAELDI
nr:glycosyltransferase family 4 protein [Stutzerimonas stutzeri]